MKKQPMRRCVGCASSDLKTNLLRFVWTGEKLVQDQECTYQMRAAYVHSDCDCINRVLSPRVWERALKLNAGTIRTEMMPIDMFSNKSHCAVMKNCAVIKRRYIKF